MTRLVDDLLDVSRATSGKIQLSLRPGNLAEVVSTALRTLHTSGRLARHEVHVDVSPVWVEMDETRMEQIVLNLAGNALKYTPAHGRIDVRVFPRGGDAVLEVEDAGVGLASDLAPRIFDLFVQGDRSLDRRAGGLGIGLTMVKRLAEMHGGRVAVQSDGPGRGSRFTVVLPAIEAPAAADRLVRGGSARPPARRILLVEDHDDARAMMRAGLEQLGHLVFDAADGPAGIQTAIATTPDVVVIDLGLPGLDGYDVARRLRTSPGLAGSVLIALTGYGQPDARQRAIDAGFDAHLTKPVAPDQLAEFISTLTAGRAAPSPGTRAV
jgi:CheY-like chemotaxis protein/two-component sensor histidine kinase